MKKKKKMLLLDYVTPIWIQSRKSKLEGPSETIWSTWLHLLVRKLRPEMGSDLPKVTQQVCERRWGTNTGASGSCCLFPSPLRNPTLDLQAWSECQIYSFGAVLAPLLVM